MKIIKKVINGLHTRSIIKAFSWRMVATLITMIISYIVTGNAKFAYVIGSLELVTKIGFFYFHELFWQYLTDRTATPAER
mgnify:CR=1 FL=1